MVKEFKRIDTCSILGVQLSDASDGVINIRLVDMNDSPQAYKSLEIVRKAFGINNARVAYSILKYLDDLDGKKDYQVRISEVEKFVVSIQNTGNAKDKIIQRLIQDAEDTQKAIDQSLMPDRSYEPFYRNAVLEYSKVIKLIGGLDWKPESKI
jgi:hypothetical protein